MSACPKCEAPAASGDLICRACGTPLDLEVARDGDPVEGPPILDPRLAEFERDPDVVYCPDCLNEFRMEAPCCQRCGGLSLDRAARSWFEEHLLALPIAEVGHRVAAGPAEVPGDLARIRVCTGLQEVGQLEQELSFLGVEAYIGSDSLDPFDDPGKVGLYVRRPDLPGARYVVEGFKPVDPLDQPPEVVQGGSPGILDEAIAWTRIGKFVEAERLCDGMRGDIEAELVASWAVLLAGRVRSAVARSVAALKGIDVVGRPRGRLLERLGLLRSLGNDGTPFGPGADPSAAQAALEESILNAPRLVTASKMLIEVLRHLEDEEGMLKELLRIDRVNPNLLGRTGPLRELRRSLGTLDPPLERR